MMGADDAKQEALALSSEGWRNVNLLLAFPENSDQHADDQVEEARELLAYRDNVAAGLSGNGGLSDATFLLDVVRCRASGSPVRWKRFREMGLADRHGRATDFGREVSRVLGGGW